MSRENNIVQSILEYLNSLPQCVAEKVQGTALSSGKADINGCFKGRSFRIEVKTPDNGNKPSKKQNVNLRRWAAAGAVALVAYSLDDVKAVFSDKPIPTHYRKEYGKSMIAELIGEFNV